MYDHLIDALRYAVCGEMGGGGEGGDADVLGRVGGGVELEAPSNLLRISSLVGSMVRAGLNSAAASV